MGFPSFTTGDVLTAADMNAVGLWLVKKQTVGNAVASVTVTDAFSSTYDNYKILYTGGVGSGTEAIRMVLGASATGYYQMLMYGTYAAAGYNGLNTNNGVRFEYVGENTPNNSIVALEMQNPFLAKYTTINGFYPGTVGGTIIGYHGVAASYTAFTLSVGTTMTGGTIYVYGYKK